MPRKLSITLDDTEMNLLAKILAEAKEEYDDKDTNEYDVDLANIVKAILDQYNSNMTGGEKTKRWSFLDAMLGLSAIDGDLGDDVAGLLSVILPSNCEYLELGLFLTLWDKTCAQYEQENGRDYKLTAGEMLWAAASAINLSIGSRAFEIGSPIGSQYATLGHVISSISGLLFQLASYNGCKRAPRIAWSTESSTTNPWSIPGKN